MRTPNTIRLIIILMALALVGLVCLQGFWLMRDLNLAQKQFDRNVKFALNTVLEKYLELSITSKPHFIFTSDVGSFSADSVESFVYRYSIQEDDSIIKRPKIKINTDMAFSSSTVINEFELKEEEIKQIDVRKEGESNNVTIIVEKLEDTTTTNDGKKRVFHKKTNTTYTGTRNTVDIEEELAFGKEALNYWLLDSLLQTHITQQGLPVKFDWGIFSSDEGGFDYRNRRETDNTELLAGYRFPLELLVAKSEQKALLIQFPDKSQYILQETAGILTASALLIIAVAIAFWLAISTILKQKKLSEIKTDFINNMTHEFKTPISNVALAIEALRNFGMMASPQTTEKYLDIAQSENKRLGKQVEKVLQMALLEKENFKLKIKTVNLNELAQQVADSFKLQIEQKGGLIRLELQANPANLEADELHLSNLIFNLVDNAHKYSVESPEITIKTESQKEGLLIKVVDKGIGIAKEHLQNIFDKFYRVPTGNLHDVKGFGLGLSYVGQVVKRHGGEIKVQSEPNQGSQFSIFLPYQQEQIS